ncbi:MAG: tetratricopeptide (TPR) repeat protein [Chlamydiales bacterium]|jgi:tetratricopeptide (TPR) repeat protein
MKIWEVFLIVVLWGSALHGESYEERVLLAERYFLGKEFTKALEVYQGVLEETLTPSERSVVNYNLGSIYLEQRNWDEAHRCFQAVSIEEDSSPLLLLGFFSNMTLLYIRQADELFHTLDEEEPSFKEQLQSVTVKVSEGLKSLEDAMEIDNQLALVEGREAGEVSDDLLKMKRVLKKLRAALVQRKHDFDLANMNFDQGIDVLRGHSRKGSERLEALGISSIDRDLKMRLMDYLVFEGGEHDAIWSAVRGKFKQRDPEEQELHQGLEDLFVEAESKNAVAMDLLREGRLWEGRNGLLHTEQILYMLDKEFSPVSFMGRIIEERVIVFRKLEEIEGKAHKRCLLDENEIHRSFILSVGKSLSQELGKNGVDVDSKISRKLLDSLLTEITENGETIEQVLRQEVFFTQIFEKEEETLLALYDRCKRDLDREVPGFLAEIMWSLEFLKEKFHEHFALEEDVGRKELIKEVLSALSFQKTSDEVNQLIIIKAAIDEAMLKWSPKILLFKKIESLFFEYSKALESMESINFEKLRKDIKYVMILVAEIREIETDSLTKLENDLSYLLQSTEWSQRVFEKGNALSSRLFFEDAVHWLKRAMGHSQNEELTAAKVLKIALEEQGVAKRENDAVAALNESVGHELMMMTRQVQETVLGDASEFLNLLSEIAEEKKALIPLEEIQKDFDLGLENAENARKILVASVPHRAEASKFQDQAKLHWEEALKKLQKQEGQPDKSDEQSEKEEQDDSIGHSEKKNENKQVSTVSSKTISQDVLQLLQEMQRDDKLRKPRKMLPKRGLRPW